MRTDLFQTQLLSLEEIAALFKDEVALDITHLNHADRAALDQRIRQDLDEGDQKGDIKMQTLQVEA